MTDVPTITPLALAAATMREWFISFVAAGFTEDQALKLCANMAVNLPDAGEQHPE